MKRRAVLTSAAAAAVAIAVGTAVVVAPSASAQGAPIVWYQAVAVPSASSPCPVTTAAEATSGWSEWTSSWEQWPNGGKGGNVCTRSITWAHKADAGAQGLLREGTWPRCANIVTGRLWINFLSSTLAPRSPMYSSAACDGIPVGETGGVYSVWAPNQADADEACGPLGAVWYGGSDPNAFFCGSIPARS